MWRCHESTRTRNLTVGEESLSEQDARCAMKKSGFVGLWLPMGSMVYLPAWMVVFFTVNVGRYTIQLDKFILYNGRIYGRTTWLAVVCGCGAKLDALHCILLQMSMWIPGYSSWCMTGNWPWPRIFQRTKAALAFRYSAMSPAAWASHLFYTWHAHGAVPWVPCPSQTEAQQWNMEVVLSGHFAHKLFQQHRKALICTAKLESQCWKVGTSHQPMPSRWHRLYIYLQACLLQKEGFDATQEAKAPGDEAIAVCLCGRQSQESCCQFDEWWCLCWEHVGDGLADQCIWFCWSCSSTARRLLCWQTTFELHKRRPAGTTFLYWLNGLFVFWRLAPIRDVKQAFRHFQAQSLIWEEQANLGWWKFRLWLDACNDVDCALGSQTPPPSRKSTKILSKKGPLQKAESLASKVVFLNKEPFLFRGRILFSCSLFVFGINQQKLWVDPLFQVIVTTRMTWYFCTFLGSRIPPPQKKTCICHYLKYTEKQ